MAMGFYSRYGKEGEEEFGERMVRYVER
jgi:hypothetical protein